MKITHVKKRGEAKPQRSDKGYVSKYRAIVIGLGYEQKSETKSIHNHKSKKQILIKSEAITIDNGRYDGKGGVRGEVLVEAELNLGNKERGDDSGKNKEKKKEKRGQERYWQTPISTMFEECNFKINGVIEAKLKANNGEEETGVSGDKWWRRSTDVNDGDGGGEQHAKKRKRSYDTTRVPLLPNPIIAQLQLPSKPDDGLDGFVFTATEANSQSSFPRASLKQQTRKKFINVTGAKRRSQENNKEHANKKVCIQENSTAEEGEGVTLQWAPNAQ
ncbi:hypothetical protein PIB30_015788 [Stylosanthes scabra]|uniref:Uncharacterized protein n=1 Tax=Stylosanthes scabra TaxID=79078 RepID=A0ABU6Z7F5_9FABA|nr:hypothetical protein [Stylosanthes scabra]